MKLIAYVVQELLILAYVVQELFIFKQFFNINLWFSVTWHLMMSLWRHCNMHTIALLPLVPLSFIAIAFMEHCEKVLGTKHALLQCTSGTESAEKAKLKKNRDWCLYWQTLGVREERKVKLGSILFTSLKIQTMLKLRNTLPLEYFFFSTSGLDRK